jgi:hypothetical protein
MIGSEENPVIRPTRTRCTKSARDRHAPSDQDPPPRCPKFENDHADLGSRRASSDGGRVHLIGRRATRTIPTGITRSCLWSQS